MSLSTSKSYSLKVKLWCNFNIIEQPVNQTKLFNYQTAKYFGLYDFRSKPMRENLELNLRKKLQKMKHIKIDN